jgi:hypothetical protein
MEILRHRFCLKSGRSVVLEPPPLDVDMSVQVYFFNDKEVDTGLSELAVVFVYEGGEEIVLGPETRGYETSTTPAGLLISPLRLGSPSR